MLLKKTAVSKRAYPSISPSQPIRRTILYSAMAVATSTLFAADVLADQCTTAGPHVINSPVNDNCILTGTEQVTIDNGGQLIYDRRTIDVSGDTGVVITIENGGFAVATGSTSGIGSAIYFTGDQAGQITNNGTIYAEGFATPIAIAAGIYTDGNITGNITNSGNISTNASANGPFLSYSSAIGANGTLSGNLINTGDLNANASRAFLVMSRGIDLANGAMSGTLTNENNITAVATSGFLVNPYGIDVDGIDANGSLTNNGTIIAEGAFGCIALAGGIAVGDDMNGTLTNNGDVISIAGSAEFAAAVGVQIGSLFGGPADLNGTLTNSGNITSAAWYANTAIAAGVAMGDLSGWYENEVGSLINVSAVGNQAQAAGIATTDLNSTGVMVIRGDINATAYSFEGDASAAAVNISGDLAGGLGVLGANTSTSVGPVLNVNATSQFGNATARGISIDSDLSDNADLAIFPGGDINVSVLAGNNLTANNDTLAEGFGISIDGTLGGNLSNAGNGIHVSLNDTAGMGSVTMTGSSLEAGLYQVGNLYGIYVGDGVSNNGSLTNTGTIDVDFVTDYSAYGDISLNAPTGDAELTFGAEGILSGLHVESDGTPMFGNASLVNENNISLSVDINNNLSGNFTVQTAGTGGSAEMTVAGMGQAYGIYVEGPLFGNANIVNNGSIVSTLSINNDFNGMADINATGVGGEASHGMYAFGIGNYGIYVDEEMDDNSQVLNNGTITLSSMVSNNNSGSLTLAADDYRIYMDMIAIANGHMGIAVDVMGANTSIVNNGMIDIDAMAMNSYSGTNDINSTMDDTDVQLYAEGGNFYGIYADGELYGNATIDNSGPIMIDTQIGNSITADLAATAYGDASVASEGFIDDTFGIALMDSNGLNDNASMVNTGDITLNLAVSQMIDANLTATSFGSGEGYVTAEGMLFDTHGIYNYGGMYGDNTLMLNTGDIDIDLNVTTLVYGDLAAVSLGDNSSSSNPFARASQIGFIGDVTGMYSEGGSGTMNNTGDINISAFVGTGLAGNLTAYSENGSASAYIGGAFSEGRAIYAEGDLDGNGGVVNTGNLDMNTSVVTIAEGNISATSNSTNPDTNRDAYATLGNSIFDQQGIYAEGELSGNATINNQGDIAITSEGFLLAEGNVEANATAPFGDAMVMAEGIIGDVAGIKTYGLYDNASLNNSGDITLQLSTIQFTEGGLSASSQYGNATVYGEGYISNIDGIRVQGDLNSSNSSLINSGDINITLAAANVFTGNISARAAGNFTHYGEGRVSIDATVDDVFGIRVDDTINGTFANSGEITINSFSVNQVYSGDIEARSQYAEGMVSLNAEGHDIYGLYVAGGNTAYGDANITNTANISLGVAAYNAFQGNVTAYGGGIIGTASAYFNADVSSLYGIYTSDLYDNASLSNSGQISIYGEGSIELNTLNNDGTVIVRPGIYGEGYFSAAADVEDIAGIRAGYLYDNTSITNSGDILLNLSANTEIAGDRVDVSTNYGEGLISIQPDVQGIAGIEVDGLYGNSNLNNSGSMNFTLSSDLQIDTDLQVSTNNEVFFGPPGLGDATVIIDNEVTDIYGIYVSELGLNDNSSLTNSGDMDFFLSTSTAVEFGSVVDASAYGYGEGDAFVDIDFDVRDVYGIYVEHGIENNATLTNSGDMSFSAYAEGYFGGSSISAYSANGDARIDIGTINMDDFHGIADDTGLSGSSSINNTGDISFQLHASTYVNADTVEVETSGTGDFLQAELSMGVEFDDLYGIYVGGSLSDNASLSNSGNITMDGSFRSELSADQTRINPSANSNYSEGSLVAEGLIHDIAGISTGGLYDNASLTNTGDIRINLSGSQLLNGDISIDNGAFYGEGYIYAEGQIGNVYGIRLGDGVHNNSSLNNTGNIDIKLSIGNRISYGTMSLDHTDFYSTSAYIEFDSDIDNIYGIYADGSLDGNLTNSGDMNISLSASNYISGDVAANVTGNIGEARVDISGDIRDVYGIYVAGDVGGTLLNTGNIAINGNISNEILDNVSAYSYNDNATVQIGQNEFSNIYGLTPEYIVVNGTVNNTGNLDISLSSTNAVSGNLTALSDRSDPSAYAAVSLSANMRSLYGIYAQSMSSVNSTLSNSGMITIFGNINNSVSGNVNARAYGEGYINITGGFGNISTNATQAMNGTYGIMVDGGLAGNANLDNTAYGDITIDLSVDNRISGNVWTGNISSYGESANGSGWIDIAGTVNATYGINVNGNLTDNASLINGGDIYQDLAIRNDISGNVTAYGSYDAMVAVAGSVNDAYGIYINGTLSGDAVLDNSGNISIYTLAENDISGNVTAISNWTVPSINITNNIQDTYGIRIQANIRDNATLTNSGDLSVSQTGRNSVSGNVTLNVMDGNATLVLAPNLDDAYGIYTDQLINNAALTNDGNIGVSGLAENIISGSLTAYSNNSNASVHIGADVISNMAGISISDQFADNATLTNNGDITLDVASRNNISGFVSATSNSTNTNDLASIDVGTTVLGLHGIQIQDFDGNASLSSNGSITINGAIDNTISGDLAANPNEGDSFINVTGTFGSMNGPNMSDGTFGILINDTLSFGQTVSTGPNSTISINLATNNTVSGNLSAYAPNSEGFINITGITNSVYGIGINGSLAGIANVATAGDIDIDLTIRNNISGEVHAYGSSVAEVAIGGSIEDAFGIHINGTLGNNATLNNSGNIAVSAGVHNLISGNVSAYSWDTGYFDTDIYAGVEDVYGIFVNGSMYGEGSLSSSGDMAINVAATNTVSGYINATSFDTTAYIGPEGFITDAYGIYVNGNLNENTTLTNSGNITVNGQLGNNISGDITVYSDNTWAGAEIVSTLHDAFGIHVNGSLNSNASLSNSGALAVNINSRNELSGNLSVDGAAPAYASLSGDLGRLYGIYTNGSLSADATLSNSGNITFNVMAENAMSASGNMSIYSDGAFAEGGFYAAVHDANGIHVNGSLNDNSSLSNMGNMNITLAATNNLMGAINVTAPNSDASVYAEGEIYDVYGIYVDGSLNSNTSLSNDGDLTISSTVYNTIGGNVSISASAPAYMTAMATIMNHAGIAVNGNLYTNATLSNNGAISITAHGENTVSGNIAIYSSNAFAEGVIDPTVTEVFGIDINGSLNDNSSLSNTDNISLTASGVNNITGDINVTGTSAYVEVSNNLSRVSGIHVRGNLTSNATLTNSGNIGLNVSSVNTISSDILANALSNQGEINVTGNMSRLTGIRVSNMDSNTSLDNSGDIDIDMLSRQTVSGDLNVTASSSAYMTIASYGERVYGLLVNGNLSDSANLSNSGNITINGLFEDTISSNLTAYSDNSRASTDIASSFERVMGIRVSDNVSAGTNVSNTGDIAIDLATNNNFSGNLVVTSPNSSATASIHGEISRAYGLYFGSYMNGTVSNSGNISLSGTVDNTMSGSVNVSAGSFAYVNIRNDQIDNFYGIYTSDSLNNEANVTNTGNINLDLMSRTSISGDVDVVAGSTVYANFSGELEYHAGIRLGGLNDNSSLNNTGTIMLNGVVENSVSGDVNLASDSGGTWVDVETDYINYFYGIYTGSLLNDTIVNNTGDIALSGHSINNVSGDINLTAFQSAGVDVTAEIQRHYGIYTSPWNGTASLSNSGNISFDSSSTNIVTGNVTINSSSAGASLEIDTDYIANFYGIRISNLDGTNHSLNNTGDINFTLSSNNLLSGQTDIDAWSSARVTVEAQIQNHYGIYTNTLNNITLTNSGNISFDANSDILVSGDVSLYSETDGAYFDVELDDLNDLFGLRLGTMNYTSNITNTGDLSFSINSNNTVTGEISATGWNEAGVEVTADFEDVYGIYVSGSLYGSGTLNNTGNIMMAGGIENTVTGNVTVDSFGGGGAYFELDAEQEYSYGIYTNSLYNTTGLSNTGDINQTLTQSNLVTGNLDLNGSSARVDLTAEFEYLAGIKLSTLYNGTVTNTGNITLDYTTNNELAGDSVLSASNGVNVDLETDYISRIYGLYLSSVNNVSAVSNTGDIEILSDSRNVISGDINATGTYVDIEATAEISRQYGIHISSLNDNATFNNSGNITIDAIHRAAITGNLDLNATSSGAWVDVDLDDFEYNYGIYLGGLNGNGSASNLSATNSGDIAISIDSQNLLSGAVNIAAATGAHISMEAEIERNYGIYASSVNNATLSNSGNISFTLLSNNTLSGPVDMNVTSGSARIDLEADDIEYTFGIRTNSLNNATLNNTGNMDFVVGSYNTISGSANITAQDSITVEATAEVDEFYGIYSSGGMNNSTLSNSGTMNFTGVNDNVISGDLDINSTSSGALVKAEAYEFEYFYGIYQSSTANGNSSISNTGDLSFDLYGRSLVTGDINITAWDSANVELEGEHEYLGGMRLGGFADNATFNNTGNISWNLGIDNILTGNITANSRNSSVRIDLETDYISRIYGIYMGSLSGNATASNTGEVGITSLSRNFITGDIDAVAQDSVRVEATAEVSRQYGVYASSINGNASLTNTGNITLDATSEIVMAGNLDLTSNASSVTIEPELDDFEYFYGIYTGSVSGDNVSFNNSGNIDILLDSDIVLSGNVSAMAFDSVNVDFEAEIQYHYGIYSNSVTNGTYTNTGDISIDVDSDMVAMGEEMLLNSTNGGAYVDLEQDYISDLYGIRTSSINNSTFSNTGEIDFTVDVYTALTRDVNATAFDAVRVEVEAEISDAYGIYVSGDVNGTSTLSNTGNITLATTMDSILSGNLDLTSTNSNVDIDVDGYEIEYHYGIYAGEINHDSSFSNTGTIDIDLIGRSILSGDVNADGYEGVYIEVDGELEYHGGIEINGGNTSGNITNTGDISWDGLIVNTLSGDVNATSANSGFGVDLETDYISRLYGLYLDNGVYGDAVVNNSGDIEILSRSVNTISGDINATAFGHVDIEATAEISRQYGMYLAAAYGDASLVNTGNITLAAYSQNVISGEVNMTSTDDSGAIDVELDDMEYFFGLRINTMNDSSSAVNNGDINLIFDSHNELAGNIVMAAYSGAHIDLTGEIKYNYGLYTGDLNGTGSLTNTGNIMIDGTMDNVISQSVQVSSEEESASIEVEVEDIQDIYGIRVGDINNTFSVNNTGNIDLMLVGRNTINGDLNVTSFGADTSDNARVDVTANMRDLYGLYNSGNMNGNANLSNSGTIDLNAFTINALTGDINITANAGNSTLEVSGEIDDVFGIYASLAGVDTTFNNTGPVTVFAGVDNDVSSDVNIVGSELNVSANVTDIYGIYLNTINGTYNNNAPVSVIADADNEYSGTANISGSNAVLNMTAFANSTGIGTSNMTSTGNLTNTGDVMSVSNAVNTQSGNVTLDGSTAATALMGASALAAGINVSDIGSLNNTGTITVSANAQNLNTGMIDFAGVSGTMIQYGVAAGAGIATGNVTGDLTNTGTVTTTSTVINDNGTLVNDANTLSSALAIGAGIVSDAVGGNVTNDGALTTTIYTDAGQPDGTGLAVGLGYGIYIDDPIGGSFSNNGDVTVMATAVNASVMSVGAIGIFTNGTGGDYVNNGSLSVAANATTTSNGSLASVLAFGAFDTGTVAGNFTNNGDILTMVTASASVASATVFGLGSNMSGNLVNNGSVTVTADLGGNIATGTAAGLYAGTTGNLINDAPITVSVTANGASVAAVSVAGIAATDVTGDLVNNGTISVAAMANGSAAFAAAYGINIAGTQSGTLVNNADLTVTASATTGGGVGTSAAYGIYIDTLAGDVVNNGTITPSVLATGSTNSAYSMFVDTGSGSTVTNNGVLNGNIYLNNTNLDNTGELNIPAGKVGYVGGDYNQTGAGVYNVEIASNTSYSVLDVAGTANISNNNIGVNVTGYIGNNVVFDNVLQTPNALVYSGNLTATSSTPLYTFTAVDDGTNIDLNVTQAATLSEIGAIIRSAEGVAGMLDNVLLDPSLDPNGDLQPLIQQLFTLGTIEEIQDAIAELVPTMDGGMAVINAEAVRALTRAVRTRLRIRGGLSGGDSMYKDRHFWMKPYFNRVDQGMRDRVPGYDMDAWGISFGADAEFSDTWRVGVGAAFTRSDFERDYHVGKNTVDADTIQVGAYADYTIDQNTQLKFQGVVGWSDYNSKRNITFLGETAKADFDSTHFRVTADYEMTSEWSPSTEVTYKIFGDYTYVDVDSYNEKGAPIGGLSVNSDSEDELIVGAGVQWDHHLSDRSVLTANADLGIDLLADRTKLTSRFTAGGPSFETDALKPSPLVFRGGIGYAVLNDSDVEINARYDVEARPDFTDQWFSINLRWKF